MSAIKIYLELEESNAIQRYAEALGVSNEDIAYAALRRLMREVKTAEDEISREIVEVRLARRQSHSPWGASGSGTPFQDHESEAQFGPAPWFK